MIDGRPCVTTIDNVVTDATFRSSRCSGHGKIMMGGEIGDILFIWAKRPEKQNVPICAGADYGVQAISTLSNQTVSVLPMLDEVLNRTRVLADIKALISWLADW